MTSGSCVLLSCSSGLQLPAASGSIVMDPFCLVENQKCQLSVNPRALKILEQISQPAVVVAIAGLYRTTKSYLMNRLAGQNHSFPLGSTVRSETRGIWMLCVHRPSKENHTLVLLDTEGLGNVETGNSKNDSCIFALAMLLSSSFVQQDEHQALEQLQYVTELTELIRTKSPPSSDKVADSTEFESFFSDLIWTVQDCMLELELDGNPITEDEYLENALKLIPGLRTLVEAYINAINSGSVPCLENAVTTLAQLENSAAVQKAAGHYSEQMTKQLSLPTDTLQELLEVHTACEKEAIAVFMECSFKDEKKDFQKKFLVMIKKKKEDCLLQDEEASVKCCQAELKKLSDPLMKSISEGTFSFPGGHHRYLEARNRFKESYKLIPRKGLKSQTYLSGLAVFILKYLYTHIDKNKKLMKTEENKSRDPEQDQDSLGKRTWFLNSSSQAFNYRIVQRLKGYRKERKESESTPNLQIWIHTTSEHNSRFPEEPEAGRALGASQSNGLDLRLQLQRRPHTGGGEEQMEAPGRWVAAGGAHCSSSSESPFGSQAVCKLIAWKRRCSRSI
ncbi:guanylate-binding protein 4 [Bos taurus]|uniref:guanylate-binding protein 4 n=1 Tax=Bos taurus TaxID=9913 RepID=UPI000D53821D|nr:guanylate-binding protein 4 [Bos taurus]